MKRIDAVFSVTAAGLVFAASPAAAYIGPGAGLSLLGALWGVVAAIGAALLFLLIWPLRRMMRRRQSMVPRSRSGQAGPTTRQGDALPRH